MPGKAISFINDKGGATKSTSCILLADYYFRILGKKVAIVDVDPRHTCLEWAARANANDVETPLMVGNATSSVGKEIEKLKEVYDYVFVDGMSSFVTSTRQDMIAGIVIASDIVFIPTEPTAFDLWAISAFAPIIQQRQTITEGSPATYLFGVKIRDNTNEWKDFLEAKEKSPFPVIDSYVPLYADIPRSTGKGETPFDLPASNKAHQAVLAWAKSLEAIIDE